MIFIRQLRMVSLATDIKEKVKDMHLDEKAATALEQVLDEWIDHLGLTTPLHCPVHISSMQSTSMHVRFCHKTFADLVVWQTFHITLIFRSCIC